MNELLKQGGRQPELEFLARFEEPLLDERPAAAAPNDLFVFYEELTARPEATLERLLGGLGLNRAISMTHRGFCCFTP